MNIYFNGGSSFLLESSKGKRILLDPQYLIEKKENLNPNVDLVLSSHSHNPINLKTFFNDKTDTIDFPSDFSNDFCKIKHFPSFHDNHNGQKRGPNRIFKISFDGFYLCHLGHLGHKLIDDRINSLKFIDLLFVPVGLYFTIGLKDIKEMIKEINPKYIIPMDYKIDNNPTYLKTLDAFLLSMKDYNYKKLEFLSLDKIENSSKPLIIILNINKKKSLESN